MLYRFHIFLLALSLSLMGCTDKPVTTEFSGPIMGTAYNVKIISDSELPTTQYRMLNDGILAQLNGVDVSLSTYKPSSELMRFNNLDVGDSLVVSEKAYKVFELSMSLLEKSDGYFDPSVGTLVSAWGFGAQAADAGSSPPTEMEVNSLLASSQMRLVEMIPETRELRKVSKGFVDLSAIAKGFAVDEVHDYLLREGFTDFMVEVGGEISVSGLNAMRQKWRLGIERPDFNSRSAYTIAHISDVAMATSGDYRNFIGGGETRYSHTINPVTGYPAKTDLASVSVISSSCASADAWATGFMAMGYERASNIADELGLAVYFIRRNDAGFISSMSQSMKQYLE